MIPSLLLLHAAVITGCFYSFICDRLSNCLLLSSLITVVLSPTSRQHRLCDGYGPNLSFYNRRSLPAISSYSRRASVVEAVHNQVLNAIVNGSNAEEPDPYCRCFLVHLLHHMVDDLSGKYNLCRPVRICFTAGITSMPLISSARLSLKEVQAYTENSLSPDHRRCGDRL